MLERPLGFWRPVLWSTITLGIFSALFWHWFDISIQAELARRTSALGSSPTPVHAGLFAALAAFLCALLGLVVTWYVRTRRGSSENRPTLLGFKGNLDLSIRLAVLVMLVTFGVIVPQAVNMTACRCCL